MIGRRRKRMLNDDGDDVIITAAIVHIITHADNYVSIDDGGQPLFGGEGHRMAANIIDDETYAMPRQPRDHSRAGERYFLRRIGGERGMPFRDSVIYLNEAPSYMGRGVRPTPLHLTENRLAIEKVKAYQRPPFGRRRNGLISALIGQSITDEMQKVRELESIAGHYRRINEISGEYS